MFRFHDSRIARCGQISNASAALVIFLWLPLVASATAKIDGSKQKLNAQTDLIKIEEAITARLSALEDAQAAKLQMIDHRAEVMDNIIEIRKDMLANSQKIVDWVLSGLALPLALVGIVVPWWLARLQKARFTADIKNVHKTLDEIRNARDDAERIANTIKGHAGALSSSLSPPPELDQLSASTEVKRPEA
jgi:hypothetical protein